MADNNSSAPLKTAEGATTLWCVHVTGADDVHPMPSREVALEEANALNTSICRIERQDIDPVLIAVVAEWPHSADSHAAGLMIRDECLRMRGDQALAAQTAPAAEPLPLLVRDIARDIGISSLDACQALKGLGNFSVNSAVTADMARKLRECFPESTEDSSAGDLAEGHPWKDHMTAQLVNQLVSVAKQFHGAQQLRERIAGLIRPLADRVKAEVQAEPVAKEVARLRALFEAADKGMHAEAARGDRLAAALRGMLQLDEENHQRYAGDEDVCKEVRDAKSALAYSRSKAPQAQPADAVDAEVAKKAARYDYLRAAHDRDDGSVAIFIDDEQHGPGHLDSQVAAAIAAAQEGVNAAKEA